MEPIKIDYPDVDGWEETSTFFAQFRDYNHATQWGMHVAIK